MIRGAITHPDILSALAAAGHGSTILIADGHYPVTTAVGQNATTVFLNLKPDWPLVTDVLEAILSSISVEKVTKVTPAEDAFPCVIQQEIDQLLPLGVVIESIPKPAFYELARSENLALCVATGDRRRFGNVLLTVGVLK